MCKVRLTNWLVPVICAYCAYNVFTLGPGNMKMSGNPLSLIQWDSVLVLWPSLDVTFFTCGKNHSEAVLVHATVHQSTCAEEEGLTSMNVSVGLNQNAAIDMSLLCPTIKGMAPYSAIGTSRSYSNTSKLYKRYGSL